MMWEETETEVAQKKTWKDCVQNYMESLGLFQKHAQFRNKSRRRIKGTTG